jgi:hypothetical protein
MFVDAGSEQGAAIECETHPGNRAVGLCVVCGRPVCSDCELKSGEKTLCNDPGHQKVLQEWCKLYQSDSVFDADAVKHNLADGGIEAKIFSLHDHIATHWLKENRVLLFVRKSEGEKAKALLQDLNLINTE